MQVIHHCATRGVLLGLLTAVALADSTIDASLPNKSAYAANAGWINWNWDPGAPNGGAGAVVSEYVLAGKVYAANFGWIDLGDGSPANSIQYQNTVVGGSDDFGVNHDGAGALSGSAYAANVGWITFAQSWTNPPAIDLKTGAFSGYAYSANLGWIDLGENGLVAVVTTEFAIGPDSDSDGISDAWELSKVNAAGKTTGSLAADLALLGDASDADGDRRDDLAEFTADTDPFDYNSYPRIIFFEASSTDPTDNITIEWTSTPTRCYDLEVSSDLQLPFSDVVTNIAGQPGSTSLLLTEPLPLPARLFFRVEAKRPLAP